MNHEERAQNPTEDQNLLKTRSKQNYAAKLTSPITRTTNRTSSRTPNNRIENRPVSMTECKVQEAQRTHKIQDSSNPIEQRQTHNDRSEKIKLKRSRITLTISEKKKKNAKPQLKKAKSTKL